ncbi:MAG TPA: bifunctional metallophosphatase/5'-nucleotidase [Lapillicoccus sp.]|jgi:5'-nucleotidase|nr:bifunctional metallophosphatase/5'-nucleotidase [Lapillicoccus sp.]
MSFAFTRRLTGVVAVGACALAGVFVTSGTSEAATNNGQTLDIQLLSFNDFHGNLEPPSGSSGRLVTDHALSPTTGLPVDVTTDSLTPPGVGGVEYLATHLKQARKGHPHSLTVAAGDLIGASPLLSAAFHDEPSIEALNKLGLDVSSVGNHEFDEGYKELQRMANGGCIDDGPNGANNQNSCALHRFKGADFPYLAANVKYAGTNETILPAYAIKKVAGAKIGFIGMTLRDTPTIVTASGIAGLEFTDEVDTANALVPVLKAQGVNAIVVLIHQGGTPGQQTWIGPDGKPYKVNPTYDAACQNGSELAPDSPIIPIAKNLSPAIDMIVSGHTHQPYICDIKDPAGQDRLVTSASSFGRLYTDTELTYDRRTQDIVRAKVESSNVLVTRNVAKDPAQTKIITDYNTAIAPVASRVIGHITADVTRTGNPAGESPLGDLIADAQLADKSVVDGFSPPVIAFMNPGGIRAELSFAASKWNEAPGDITYEEAFTVQPFNNYLVSMDLKGSDIYALLTQQVTGLNSGSQKKTLQVSAGFTYTMTPTGPVDGSVALNGVAIDKNVTYRIVTNNFLSDGGDNFPAFKNGTNKYFGGLDIDAFAAYLTAKSPYSPAVPTRISGTN